MGIATTLDILEHAFDVMWQAHRGQVDKGGNHYFLHPFRVSQEIKKHFTINKSRKIQHL